jgi:isopentenyl-diphosphate Delta-isomerase
VSEDHLADRKSDHLRIAIEQDVEVRVGDEGAFAGVRLVHQALPEIDLDGVDPSVELLGRKLEIPLLIGSMTGGTAEAMQINRRLAEAAQRCGVGMCLGSQRIMLEQPGVAHTFAVRDGAPDVLLVANIGAVQLRKGVTGADARRVANEVGADALVFHLNAAHEAVQPNGDTCFEGLTSLLGEAVAEAGLPCGVKEVGSGISLDAAERLATLPLAFIESAGRGGTSWPLVEGMRKRSLEGQRLGALFADWGVPSLTSLLACLRHAGGTPIIASGGVRNGLDAARALAVGATATAMALPLLRAAHKSSGAVVDAIMDFRSALVTAMFLAGARNLDELRSGPRRIARRWLPEVWEGRAESAEEAAR